jgi:hypothetical protein
MKMKKPIIIFSIIALLAVLVTVLMYVTSAIVITANDFFNALKEKNYEKAYSYLSEDFKANTSKDQLVEFLHKSALLNFKEISWNHSSISNENGELDGVIVTETGEVAPIEISFIKENNEWKIYSIFKPQAGLVQKNSSRMMPSVDELIKLANESMLKFSNSVNAKDFKEFHSYVSNLFQRNYDVKKFNKVFKYFIDNNINMVPLIKENNPIFNVEPYIDQNGRLVLDGYYAGLSSKINFEIEYIYEDISWKIISIRINIE